ncbi:MAG: MepB family protein [Devosia sp.]
MPAALTDAIRDVYLPAGLVLDESPIQEAESSEYDAMRLRLNGAIVVYRTAKVTPTKIGQFVTIWKRPHPAGPIAPLDSSDGVALVIVRVSDGLQAGQFVFDRATLLRRGVMSKAGVGGKRAIRVYPPWSLPVAPQAILTQQWQLQHFLPLGGDHAVAKARQLFAVILPGSAE